MGNPFQERVDERKSMVSQQIKMRGVREKLVLEAVGKVPRHFFVNETFQEYAYHDNPLPIGEGQTISQPYMVALMTEALGIKGGEKILEVGTGSGYQAAVLAEIADKVYTIERISGIADKASQKLEKLEYNNVKVCLGDGSNGLAEYALYDGIIVTAAAPEIPDALMKQLKVGGKLVIPVGSGFSQDLAVIEKLAKGKLKRRSICACVFVPLIGEFGWKQ